MTLVSDYRFRGISQTYEGPAVQGGFDYSHSSGFYLGNWNSNVASQVYTGGSGIEMDVYGGYKRSFGGFGLDIGYLYYHYPNAEFQSAGNGSQGFDSQDIYLGGSWKWISLKYSPRRQRLLRPWIDPGQWRLLVEQERRLPAAGSRWIQEQLLPRSDGEPPGWEKLTIGAHVGTLKVKNYGELDYTDWKLGVTYNLKGWLLGAAYVDTDASRDWYYTGGSKGNKDTGTATVVVSVGKTF